VVPLARVLLAPHQGQLADRRRRRADQPGIHGVDILRWLAGPVKELFGEVVEAEGHLIDSHIMENIFDKVVEYHGRFEVEQFRIGAPTASRPICG
jgi:hypothetical protein